MIHAFSTKRLRIGPWCEEHVEAFFDLTQDDGFNSYPITVYRQTSVESARRWIRDAVAMRHETGLGKMGIWEKEKGTLIGMGGLTPWEWEGEHLVDLTYRIRSDSWGVGYG